jgi:hypothetical protein
MEDLAFKIVKLDGARQEIVALIDNFAICKAAFETFVYPKEHLEMRNGARIILKSKTLRRRSQMDRITWARMAQLADTWLPKPIILHPWPSDRFAVTHPRWEKLWGGRRRLWHLHRPYELMEVAPWYKSTISAEA